MSPQLREAIARLRRAQPRNWASVSSWSDTMLVCDALEASFAEAKPKFDKVAYQREYMRKRRATK